MSSYLEKLFSLKGKTAIITGASKGIGAEIALAYVKSGANVVCVARSETTEKEQISEFYHQCDITDSQQFRSICELTSADYGGIDILVNAAGVSLSKDENQDEVDRFKKTISVNLVSTYQCCDLASQHMHNGGSIINITSIGSIQGFPDNPGYVASKGGVRALTKAIARDLCVKNIRVNNIAPGYIRTDMTRQSFENLTSNQERINQMMIKRWGDANDLVGAAIFLASEASSYMTGSSLVVDGGWVAKGL